MCYNQALSTGGYEMIDIRFDGEELLLWIERNTTPEELELLLKKKVENIFPFVEEGTPFSIFLDAGMEQKDLLLPVLDGLQALGIQPRSIFFEKKPPHPQPRNVPGQIQNMVKTLSPEKQTCPPSLLVESPIRSGQVVEHMGDLILLGDLHPGGEIQTGGNLIVFGDLRGTARVGKNAPESAFIIATSLHPTLLQIGTVHSNSIFSDHFSMCCLKNGRLTLKPVTDLQNVSGLWKP